MSLQERAYSILLVSAAPRFNAALEPMLSASLYSPVFTVASISAARQALAQRAFDFVLVHSPLPDDQGLRFAAGLCASSSSAVLVLVRAELYEEIYYKMRESGVFLLPRPLSRPALERALHWMASARERLRKLEKKSLSMEEKMAEIRLVNRAKWLLIQHLGLNEAQAHRHLEKQAMDLCITKRQAAEEVLKEYS